MTFLQYTCKNLQFHNPYKITKTLQHFLDPPTKTSNLSPPYEIFTTHLRICLDPLPLWHFHDRHPRCIQQGRTIKQRILLGTWLTTTNVVVACLGMSLHLKIITRVNSWHWIRCSSSKAKKVLGLHNNTWNILQQFECMHFSQCSSIIEKSRN